MNLFDQNMTHAKICGSNWTALREMPGDAFIKKLTQENLVNKINKKIKVGKKWKIDIFWDFFFFFDIFGNGSYCS